MSDIRYKRVLLKLSGEALMGDGQYGIDPKVTDHLAKQVKELLAVGHEVGVVVGGGNIFRGMAGAAGGMERAQADYMGVLATVMNALALQDAFEHNDVPCRVMSAIQMNETDAAFAIMVKTVLPAGIKGIVTIGFICALVASLAAFFNSCATLFTEDFYKPLKKGMSEAHYVLVGRIATVVVVVLGFAWLPIMMKMDTLYNYLQGIQSLLAPAMVAVFAMGIFFKKITPKAGEYTMITGFLIGMLRLVTNVITDTGKATMDGAFWDYTAWFWQTNWLVFECWLLVFLIIFMVVVSCFTPAPSKEQVEAITFTSDFKKSIRESWSAFDIIGTLVVIGLCAAFYAYFW